MKKYTVEKRKIPSTGRDIKILIFRPTAARKEPAQTPGILWIHGGGYATGMAGEICHLRHTRSITAAVNPQKSRGIRPRALFGTADQNTQLCAVRALDLAALRRGISPDPSAIRSHLPMRPSPCRKHSAGRHDLQRSFPAGSARSFGTERVAYGRRIQIPRHSR